MSQDTWKVRVVGIVSRWLEGGRYPVTEAEWKMQRLEGDKFRFTRFDEDPFDLSGREVRTYVQAKALRILEGEWP